MRQVQEAISFRIIGQMVERIENHDDLLGEKRSTKSSSGVRHKEKLNLAEKVE